MPCSIEAEAHQRQGDSTKTCHAGRGLSAGLQCPIGKIRVPEASRLRVEPGGLATARLSHELTNVCAGKEEGEVGEVVRKPSMRV